MKPETVLAHRCKAALTRLGVVMVRVQSGTAYGGKMQLAESGTPDWILLFPGGITRWLELKFGKNKPRPKQIEWRERAERMGHVVDTAYSFEEVMAIVKDVIERRSA